MSTRASISATTLRGRWLLLTRAAWVTIATIAISLFVASIPGYISNVLELDQADRLGSTVEAPAGLVFVLDLLGVLAFITSVLVCLTLAGLLFWRKSEDWMVRTSFCTGRCWLVHWRQLKPSTPDGPH